MSEDWAAIAADATQAIASVGFAATLIRASTGPVTPYDATSPVAGAPVPVTVVRNTWTRRNVDGQRVRADDQWFLIDSTAEIRHDDKLLVQGVELQVVDFNPLSPGGVTLLYEVQARR